jgi:hypothetical protein
VVEVSQWTRNHNIDVKIIMQPINIDQHWSLCSIYLTSNFCSFCQRFLDADTSDASFILHLDSYNLHNGEEIACSIWGLDVEWKLKFSGNTSLVIEFCLPLVINTLVINTQVNHMQITMKKKLQNWQVDIRNDQTYI